MSKKIVQSVVINKKARQLLKSIRLARVDKRGSVFVSRLMAGEEVLLVVVKPEKPGDLELCDITKVIT